MNGASFTRAAIRELLLAGRPAPRGDAVTAAKHAGAGEVVPLPPERYGAAGMTASLRPAPDVPVAAAVLVPLVEYPDGFSILLTQRTADLKAHAGQISFPGGRIEPDDADAVAAALRESREEIGLAGEQVEVLGRLDSYVTITGFEVTPVVGAVRPPLALTPDPVEVAEIFEVPLAFVLDPANHRLHSRAVGGAARAYYALPYGDRYIWGATAGMLLNLYDVLTANAPGAHG